MSESERHLRELVLAAIEVFKDGMTEAAEPEALRAWEAAHGKGAAISVIVVLEPVPEIVAMMEEGGKARPLFRYELSDALKN